MKILHDQVVDEGDSVTIECKNPHDDDHGMIGRAPQFTQKLEDHEVGSYGLQIWTKLSVSQDTT